MKTIKIFGIYHTYVSDKTYLKWQSTAILSLLIMPLSS
jgi:hypothetical protein